MGKLVVRSKSHTKLRGAYAAAEPLASNNSDADQVSAETSPPGQVASLAPTFGHVAAAKGRRASPSRTPGFEVLSRPKTANEAMDEQRRRRLMAMGDTISVTEGKDTFDFPTPARKVSPALTNTPAYPLPAPMPTFERSGTPDTIGIALGSPSHLAQFENQMAESVISERIYARSNESATPVDSPRPDGFDSKHVAEPSRPKLSRWRSIGGLFARKPSSKDLQQREQTAMQTYPGWSGNGLKGYHTWEQSSPRLRSGTEPRSTPASMKSSPRVGIERSQTVPTTRRNGDSPEPPPKDFLAVEIPTTKMERYSIMFNGILPNEPGGLLARRQSKREVARQDGTPAALSDLNILPPPKRPNTADPAASPSYRLLVFPPDNSNKKILDRRPSLVHRPRPLKRTNSAPGALSPGLRNKMAPLSPMSEASESLETETDATEITGIMTGRTVSDDVPEDDELDFRKDEAERQALTPTPSEPSTPTTPEDTQSVHSYNPFHGHASTQSWDKSIQEPDWEMITIGKIAEPGDRFSSAQAVRVVDDTSPIETTPDKMTNMKRWHPLHMHKHPVSPLLPKHGTKTAPVILPPQTPPKPAVTTPIPASVAPRRTGPAMANATMTTAAQMKGSPLRNGDVPQVQVARSMSVTRAQRVKAIPAVRMGAAPRGVESGRGENLLPGRQPMVPRVVSLEDKGPGHKPAKSVVGILESA